MVREGTKNHRPRLIGLGAGLARRRSPTGASPGRRAGACAGHRCPALWATPSRRLPPMALGPPADTTERCVAMTVAHGVGTRPRASTPFV